MKKIQELPTPEELKKEFPLPYKVQKIKKQRDQEIEDIFTGKDDRLILIIGPGSLTLAHSQNSQMSFMYGFFFVKFLFFTVVCVVIVV